MLMISGTALVVTILNSAIFSVLEPKNQTQTPTEYCSPDPQSVVFSEVASVLVFSATWEGERVTAIEGPREL